MITFTHHAEVRAAQRNLNLSEIQYIKSKGVCYHRAGSIIYYLRSIDIPKEEQANQRVQQLCGTALIFAKDNQTLITLWRDVENGLRRIKHKTEYSTYPSEYRSSSWV